MTNRPSSVLYTLVHSLCLFSDGLGGDVTEFMARCEKIYEGARGRSGVVAFIKIYSNSLFMHRAEYILFMHRELNKTKKSEFCAKLD